MKDDRTERGRYGFEGQAYPDGTPFIVARAYREDDDLSVLRSGFLGFDLQEGVSFEDFDKLLAELTSKIKYLTFTNAR